jgi:hypothetical protein
MNLQNKLNQRLVKDIRQDEREKIIKEIQEWFGNEDNVDKIINHLKKKNEN